MKEKAKARGHRYAAPIGIVFILLAVIGFFTLMYLTFNLTADILNNQSKKREYEEQLLPMVLFDPPAFEDPTTIRNDDLLLYSVWGSILSKNPDERNYDENMNIIIPASDVEMEAYHMFGPDVKLKHHSFGDFENNYTYDETTVSYYVPVIDMTGFYTPKVVDIVKNGSTVNLTVGYLPPQTILNLQIKGGKQKELQPAKYMIYEMHAGKNGMYLYAIRDLEGAQSILGHELTPEEISQLLAGNKIPGGDAVDGSIDFGGKNPDFGDEEASESVSESESEKEEEEPEEESEEEEEPSTEVQG